MNHLPNTGSNFLDQQTKKKTHIQNFKLAIYEGASDTLLS